ncbi:hypothetical protein [Tenacibaculum maritimum]|uniref:hypothetical protein n=1 Tax=Tenacibaculum maritimum TaxID=107401 RepID=UPI002307075D|nr:hypothetical protein [Tenacibaculum maritimum]MDB0601357.1 hypothetical protein [Tenacibaculum maritimum]MDB0611778.1 hypothetical protein [Tenacibaculum maritimum]
MEYCKEYAYFRKNIPYLWGSGPEYIPQNSVDYLNYVKKNKEEYEKRLSERNKE